MCVRKKKHGVCAWKQVGEVRVPSDGGRKVGWERGKKAWDGGSGGHWGLGTGTVSWLWLWAWLWAWLWSS